MEGIDVSAFQRDIDWSKAVKGLDFVYLKASEGINAYDPTCQYNAKALYNLNFPFGYYHFATLNILDVVRDATQEAYQLLAHLSVLPKAKLALALDIEDNKKLNLPPDQVYLWITTFLSIVKPKYKVILYSYGIFLNDNLPKNHNLGQYPLWIAQYSNSQFPKLPNGWNEYAMWQWSNKGQIAGINANVDLNHARKLIYN